MVTNLSPYQIAIYDFVKNGFGNAIVDAVAGSGKTTTGVGMISQFPETSKGKFMAFAKRIADELAKRITHPNATASTYNSFGNAIVKEALKTKFDRSKVSNILKYNLLKGDEKKQKRVVYPATRVVSLMKNMYTPSADGKWDSLYDYVLRTVEIDVPNDVDFKSITLEAFQQSLSPSVIDYDDQKFLPIYMGLPFVLFDFLIVDEFQDTSPLEWELIKRSCPSGRIIPFGDLDQCIFKFKGADENIFKNFQGLRLPLSVCYRCPSAVVEHAQKIVPRIEPFSGAIRGIVDTVEESWMLNNIGTHDLVLGRTNADVVSYCMKLIAEGRPAYVLGKEVANGIEFLIARIKCPDGEIVSFKQDLDLYVHSKLDDYRKLGFEGPATLLEDQYDVLLAIMPGCKTVYQLISKLKSLFVDKGEGIACMTIHKAKGLESGKGNTTWIVRPDKIPHPRAKDTITEDRLHYVAITRAQGNLFYVQKSNK